jgi:hypothetical protein
VRAWEVVVDSSAIEGATDEFASSEKDILTRF